MLMTVHREGKVPIFIALILLAIAWEIDWATNFPLWLDILIVFPFVVILALILWFFRIPSRPMPLQNNNVVVAPADGEIVVIEKIFEPEYFKDERIQVSIFMSPFNVHQNVYPIAGKVTYTKYHKGKYLVAWHPKSSTENERSTVVVKTVEGKDVLFRQIAGAMARRICTYAQPGDKAFKGMEFGFIKFGSRVDIFLPVTAKILCAIGDTTFNKMTELAEI
jgi:phosphatidylserine decarboxylase